MTERAEPAIRDADMPALYQAADKASFRAQKLYARVVAFDLAVMIAGAILGAASFSEPALKQELALASAVCIAVSFALTFALKAEHLSGTWYDGRAVAESTKTSAWRYMMCAEPYFRDVPEQDADRMLTTTMDSLLKERKNLAGTLSVMLMSLPQITATMRAVRLLPLGERKSAYLASRLGDQRAWYSTKAERNRRKSSFFFLLILVSQALALVAAIALVRWPDAPLNMTGVFAAIAAALIAWTQLQKHQELAAVYGLTAHELGSAEGQARYAESEEAFSEFVSRAESTIAREHSLWLARRDRY